jgi:hypothetical protein
MASPSRLWMLMALVSRRMLSICMNVGVLIYTREAISSLSRRIVAGLKLDTNSAYLCLNSLTESVFYFTTEIE